MAANEGHSAGSELARALGQMLRWMGGYVRGEVVELVGGPARARVIVLFAAVLALGGADAATVGAMAPQLERSLHIGTTKIGLLSSVTLLVGAVFTIPVGLFVDKVKRMPLLALSIVLWSIASLFSAFASSFSGLLLARLALGAVTATAGPAIASLTGDYFPSRERGRVYAYILGGETAGAAFGFIICGSVASLLSWRVSFVLLAIPGFFLARELHRTVPEPLRGGQSRLEPGALVIPAAPAAPPDEPWPEAPTGEQATGGSDEELARSVAAQRGFKPDPARVLREDPRKMGLGSALRYILAVRSNWLMIIGSSLGYFFFAGLSTFALLFVRGQYHVGQASSELGLALLVGGALIGTLASGSITDLMLRRGILESRVLVPAGCYMLAAVVLLPGILSHHMYPAVWFDAAGAALISAANPPLNAARLDIMPAGLWGRAESARTFIRSLMQALAPLLFGGLASLIAGFAPAQAPIGTHPHGLVSASTTTGLKWTFLIMLASLVAAGVFLYRAHVSYPRDVATAGAAQPRSAAPSGRRADAGT
ncbi:MAG TPA: MFS transporter [Solirubrobacteraceae bacterium]|nr:MFS transporter [Solirubrobacteraceae bacterium]